MMIANLRTFRLLTVTLKFWKITTDHLGVPRYLSRHTVKARSLFGSKIPRICNFPDPFIVIILRNLA